MSEITAITSADLQETKETEFPKVVTVDWHGKEIYVRSTIGLDEMLEFVDAVVDACMDEAGTYFPQFRDCMFRLYTIMYYTNIAPSGDLKDQYDFVYGSDLFDTVVYNIDAGQLNDIKSAINARINYAVNVNIRKFNDGIKQLVGMAEGINSAFGDVSKEEMASVLKALSQIKNVDEGKLAQAVVEAQNGTKKKQNKRKPRSQPKTKTVHEVTADDATEDESLSVEDGKDGD